MRVYLTECRKWSMFMAVLVCFTIPSFGGSVPGSLDAAYPFPNPFRPGSGDTSVAFTNLPQYTYIEVFNTSGLRKVAFWGPTGGLPFVSWNFKDSGGGDLPDDVYYAVITDTPTAVSRKLYLLKAVGGAGQTLTRNIPALSPGTETIDNYDASGFKIGSTTLIIRGTETGSISVVGGAKGFVNPVKGEKLTIGFKPTTPGTIKTRIFDATGRLVKEISAQSSGTEGGSLQWDARDSSGRVVPSGVYLIKVEGPGINVTKRTVILK